MAKADAAIDAKALGALAKDAIAILDKPLTETEFENFHKYFGEANGGCTDVLEVLGVRPPTDAKTQTEEVLAAYAAANTCETRRDFALLLKPVVIELAAFLQTIERKDD
jgi:hypothetical protein